MVINSFKYKILPITCSLCVVLYQVVSLFEIVKLVFESFKTMFYDKGFHYKREWITIKNCLTIGKLLFLISCLNCSKIYFEDNFQVIFAILLLICFILTQIFKIFIKTSPQKCFYIQYIENTSVFMLSNISTPFLELIISRIFHFIPPSLFLHITDILENAIQRTNTLEEYVENRLECIREHISPIQPDYDLMHHFDPPPYSEDDPNPIT